MRDENKPWLGILQRLHEDGEQLLVEPFLYHLFEVRTQLTSKIDASA